MSWSKELGEQHEVTLPQGTIGYRERGSGEPIVFVHGVLVNGDLWRGVAPRLADQGYRCIVPDWPLGSHAPPMRADADLSPPGLARLIADFVDALGLQAPTIVANDTGGALTQIAAANHGERFGRLVLTSCDAFEHFFPVLFRYLSVTARIPGSLSLLRRSVRLRAIRRSPIAFGWLMRQDPPPEVLESWAEPLAHADIRRDAAKVLRAIDRRYTLEAAEKLRSFAKPVLLAWAAEDRVFPLTDAERLASILPNARLRPIENSYSFVPEDQPEELAAVIAEFMRGGDELARARAATGAEKAGAG